MQKNTQEWQTWKIQLKDKKMYFYINDKLQYTPLAYHETTGMLKEIGIYGKGAIAVDWVRLRNGAGKEVYFEDFDNPNKPTKPRL